MQHRSQRLAVAMLAGWAAALLLALPAAGQSLIDGSFDTPADLAIWQNADAAIWSMLDFAQSPTSGSARIENDLDVAGSYVIWAFAAVNPGEILTFRVRAWIPPDQMGSGRAQLRVVWWDASGAPGGFCPFAQTSVGSDQGESTTVTGSWELLQATLEAPPGATCAQLRLRNAKSDAALFVVHFDEAEIFLPGPGSASGAAAAIGALALLGRRGAWRRRRDPPGCAHPPTR